MGRIDTHARWSLPHHHCGCAFFLPWQVLLAHGVSPQVEVSTRGQQLCGLLTLCFRNNHAMFLDSFGYNEREGRMVRCLLAELLRGAAVQLCWPLAWEVQVWLPAFLLSCHA